MIVGKLGNYKGSRDYVRLAELAKTESIICIVDCHFDDVECLRNISKTLYASFPNGVEYWQISARGVCYVTADSLEKFMRRCEKENVEFIEPEETPEEIAK